LLPQIDNTETQDLTTFPGAKCRISTPSMNLVRLNLDVLEPVTVDFDAIPFGCDNSRTGIYRQRHGDKYYVGPKPWLTDNRAEFTFLTTESLVEKVIVGSLKIGAAAVRVAGFLQSLPLIMCRRSIRSKSRCNSTDGPPPTGLAATASPPSPLAGRAQTLQDARKPMHTDPSTI
jgi:hypothetical protein